MFAGAKGKHAKGEAERQDGERRRRQEEALDDGESLDVARRVLRQALDHCLEGREIRTRTVARSMARRGAS